MERRGRHAAHTCFCRIKTGRAALVVSRTPLPLLERTDRFPELRRDEVTVVQTIEGNAYAFPEYFELALRSETAVQLRFIEAAAAKYLRAPLRRLLEPGCGSGRLLRVLAERGYSVTGLDTCSEALEYLNQELTGGQRRRVRVTNADMTRFDVGRNFDLAFCFCNTFRHLLTETAALAHLESVSRAVRRRGLYLLGLHVYPADADLESIERWSESARGVRVHADLRMLRHLPLQRRERLRLTLRVKTAQDDLRIRSDFDFRTYSVGQLCRTIRRSQRWQIAGVFDFDGDLDRPQALDEDAGDVLLVLRRP